MLGHDNNLPQFTIILCDAHFLFDKKELWEVNNSVTVLV